MRDGARRAAALLLAALACYAPVLRGGFLWDDEAYVVHNAALRTLGGLWRIWAAPGAVEQYYPLTYTAFWLQFQLWGLSTVGYHVVNVLLHVLNAFLAGTVLERLKIRGAWLAAFLFLVHPVHLESVAWITELKNVLSGALYLGALLAFLEHERARDGRLRALSLALFSGALLSKSVTCTLPAALLLLAWARRGRVDRRDLAAAAPYFALGLLVGGMTLYVEKVHIGASGPGFDFTPAQRLLIAGRALWFYLGKLAWPHPLLFMYPRWELSGGWLYPAGWLALLGALWARRGALGRWPLTAFLFFSGTLVPALGFVSIYTMRFSYAADHFQYLASLGPLAAAAAALAAGLERLRSPRARGLVLAALFAVLVLDARRESRKFTSAAELWLDTLEKDPESAMARHHVGVMLAQAGQHARALAELETAERLDPTLLQTHLALAFVRARLGRRRAALDSYEKAFALGASDPRVRADYEALKAGGPPPKD